MTRRLRWLSLVVVLPVTLAAVTVLPGCKKTSAATTEATPEAAALPVVTDDSTGLIFTWLDEKGEFHTGEKVSDVPLVGRDQVRVMDPEHDNGENPDRIFIVDLRTAGEGGKYPTRSMKRADYDALAEGLRKKTGPTLASVAPHEQPAGPGGTASGHGNAAAPGVLDPSGVPRPAVIVYGASWCGACHEAMAYMKKKGIAYVDKDIEKDTAAAREMQSKLARAGMKTGSIPILDVGGKILVGFSKESLDQALGAML